MRWCRRRAEAFERDRASNGVPFVLGYRDAVVKFLRVH
jgi:hypothetical protein